MLSQSKISDFLVQKSKIIKQIRIAAQRANRNENEINLVAVSKTQPKEVIIEAIKSGHRVFGENKVQEAISHFGDLTNYGLNRDDLEIRLIGPLQTNKCHDAVEFFDVIETIDRIKLAQEIEKSIQKVGKAPKLLVQVNIGNEPQKSGVEINNLGQFLDDIREKNKLEISGLMAIPPNNEAAGPYFALMQKLAKKHCLKTLSMGMSSDFETAIMFGSTHIRVGTALFGERTNQ